jgi:hypothetical protein
MALFRLQYSTIPVDTYSRPPVFQKCNASPVRHLIQADTLDRYLSSKPSVRLIPQALAPCCPVRVFVDWLGHLYCRNIHHNNFTSEIRVHCGVGSMMFIVSLTTEKKEASL